MSNTSSRTHEFANGTKLTIQLLPASVGVPLATKLMSVIGGAFSDEGLNLPALIGVASEKIDIYDLAKTLLTGALVSDDEKDDFPLTAKTMDTFFAGNYRQLIDFCTFAITENFGDFFG